MICRAAEATFSEPSHGMPGIDTTFRRESAWTPGINKNTFHISKPRFRPSHELTFLGPLLLAVS